MRQIITQLNGYYVTLNDQFLCNLDVYRLRDRVFVKELGWVEGRNDDMEIDEYDTNATHLCLFNPDDQLIGTVRLIESSHQWMIEDCFAMLLPQDFCLEKHRNTVEVSRLAIKREMRKKKIDIDTYTVDLLLKGLFIYAYSKRYSHFYMVVSNFVYRLLNRRGIPCFALGKSQTMDDGVVALAAKLNLNYLLYSTNNKEICWSIYSMCNELKDFNKIIYRDLKSRNLESFLS